ncbi:choice-of-anchor I family protein [Alloalcanivorax xenomutans]|uniref:choice-of-anchor I family protein n=1 Tax=Alloalcanivorax xenomutans TaxID=1094342 RepID=UPI0029313C9F|nr:choice-of-anchor I family protein [Alloalcanivorax xenomutans]WOA32005.1 choice-of-anchor I family protein [Alloalcanivorax xenomutans]
MATWRLLATTTVLAAALSACGGDSDNNDNPAPVDPPVVTPESISLQLLGRYKSGQFDASAAEITAYHAGTKRAFVVNAQKGAVDVLDLSDPANPVHADTLTTESIGEGTVVNSVAVHGDLVALAVEAPTKTDQGHLALYDADTLELISTTMVGAQPDMVTFTPNGQYVLLANEGEPSDDYSVDPEGSISVVDIIDPASPQENTADFTGFDDRKDELLAAGVRIYGPGASVAMDLEPEYIAVSADGGKAWVTLQENNALAIVDIAKAEVTNIVALGAKDHGEDGNGLDVSDDDGAINIVTWPGVKGLYLPDAIAAYPSGGATYLVTANEGDARAWGEDNAAYFGTEDAVPCDGDVTQGFVEEWRVKHLVHANGFDRRCGDDLPAHLRALAAGALLNPETFSYCGATAGDPGTCRDDEKLGRLNITWTEGYRTDEAGNPVMFNEQGLEDANGDRLMYDNLYAFGGRSFSIWDEQGALVWDSGDAIEQFLAGDECMLGSNRDIPCKDFFNSNHDEGSALESRSDNKGPEPEGLTIGQIGDKHFLFLGLERMGGILVYDITDPAAPIFQDYLNTREDWTTEDPSTVEAGDLGPEGLVFIPADQSPNEEALLIVGNEVSGTTAIYRVESKLAD